MSNRCNPDVPYPFTGNRTGNPGGLVSKGLVSNMSRKLREISRGLWLLPLMLGTGVVLADEHESMPAEATIRLMDDADADLPDAILNDIPLPDLPATSQGEGGLENAAGNAERREIGQEVAERTRDNARENAADMASEARENARENAADMASEARDNAESRGRSEEFRPVDLPQQPGGP